MKRFNKILTVFIAVVLAACIGSGFGITSFAADSYNNKYSLTIGENIVTNYEIDAKAYRAADGATLEYSYLDATGEQIATKTETIDLTSAGDTVTFSVPQAAAQIAEPVTITVKSANGQNVDTFTASAKDYCDRYVDKTDAELKDIEKGKRLREICRSVIAYAYAAQQQFDEYMSNPGTVSLTDSYFNELDIPNTDYTDTTDRENHKGTRVKFKSFSYFCTSTARLRFYLDTSTATQEELNAVPTASNLPEGVKINKGHDAEKGYFIDVNGLTPLDFDKVFRIDYADAYISMSVLQYAGAIIASSKSTTDSKNLARTLIAYYNKTVKYVDDNATVTFNGNGGTSDIGELSAEIGNTVTLPTASYSGYTFDNWYTEAGGGDLVGANGVTYAPKDDTTLYAHWLKNYTITINNTDTETTIKRYDTGETVVSGQSYPCNKVYSITVNYNKSNDHNFAFSSNISTYYSDAACTNATTSKDAGTYYFIMPEGNISVVASCSGAWYECVTADTLITLADGSQKRIDEITDCDELLVWNLETGQYDTAPTIFIDNVGKEKTYKVVHLYFSDGTETKIIGEHGYFDFDKGEYVYITINNYRDYIGDRFVKQADINSNTWETVTLVDSEVVAETARPYSTNTVNHLCFYVDGMLSMPGGISGLFNIFEVDTSTMTYDFDAMQRDIETYGLYTYEDFEGLISYETFEAVNCAYLKISVGKGLMTEEDILYLAEIYAPFLD